MITDMLHICGDYRRGLDCDFIDHFTTRLGTTSNYNVIANHILKITSANAKSFQPAVSSLVIFWQRLLTVEVLQCLRSCHSRLAISQLN
jgi:hypothetical protein